MFERPFETLGKAFEHFQITLVNRPLAVSFCPFNGWSLVDVVAWKVTYFKSEQFRQLPKWGSWPFQNDFKPLRWKAIFLTGCFSLEKSSPNPNLYFEVVMMIAWWWWWICEWCQLIIFAYINVNFINLRVFGCLVLILFLEGRRCPSGLDAQQNAEIRAKEVFSKASSAIGMLVGINQTLQHILKVKAAELSKAMAQTCPEMDDRCRKNYAVLISLAEKVWNTECWIDIITINATVVTKWSTTF